MTYNANIEIKTETACSLQVMFVTTHMDAFAITAQEMIMAIIQNKAATRAATKHIPCILITGGLITPTGSLSMAAFIWRPTYKIEKRHYELDQS